MSKIGNYIIEMQEAHMKSECLANCYVCKVERDMSLLMLATAPARKEGDCTYCDSHKDTISPPHHASSRCKSGGHNHCSCDTCF